MEVVKKKSPSKKDLLSKIQILERQNFLDIYFEFNDWLKSIGFRNAHYWECGTPFDCHYEHYNRYVNSLYGVEHYIHDSLKLSVRFLRDRMEYKFIFVVGNFGAHSPIKLLEETKSDILKQVRELRDAKLKELEAIKNI